ncbi:MAG: N-acyl homoserine lactonase family protein [Solirubrobacterales bacterium]
MRFHADAIPLDEPLPGGSRGAKVVVEPMVAGSVEFPHQFFEREPGLLSGPKSLGFGIPRKEWWRVPCPAFLVRHPTAGEILVDTGLHPSIAAGNEKNMGRFYTRRWRPQIERGEDVPAQLRAKGLDARDIQIVVMTHLHVDHASCISEFGESTFVVSASEWDAATTDPRPMLRGYHPPQYDFAFDYRLLDFETEEEEAPINSYGPFARTVDLLGDGSILLAYTPGHTVGHMSVILRLERRDFVIAGDAIYTWRQLEGGPEPSRMVDEHSWRRSLQELQLFHREYPYAVIVPGHDPDFYAKLEDRYEE